MSVSLSVLEKTTNPDGSIGEFVSSDKDISEAVVTEVSRFIFNNNYELQNRRQTLRDFSTALTSEKIKFWIKFINNHPLVRLVDSIENEDESGNTRITMEKNEQVDRKCPIAFTSNARAIRGLERRGEVKILQLTKSSFETLKNYKNQIEDLECGNSYQNSDYQRLESRGRPRRDCWEPGCGPDLAKFLASSACCLFSLVGIIINSSENKND